MARKFYSNRHYERLSNGAADTAETVAERLRYNEARAKAWTDVEHLLGEGCDPMEFLRLQKERIDFYLRAEVA